MINLADIQKGNADLKFFIKYIYFKLNFMLSCRFAYIEFAEKDSVQTAMALDDSLFKGRIIKV